MPTMSTVNIHDIHLLNDTVASAAENDYIVDTVNTLVDKFVNLFGSDHLSIMSHGTPYSGTVGLHRISKEYDEQEFANQLLAVSSGSNLDESRWTEAQASSSIGHFSYTHSFFQIAPSQKFREIMELLIGVPKGRSGITSDIMEGYLDKMTSAVDELFIQQSIEPTTQKRSNLLGLAWSINPKVQNDEKVQKLLGTKVNDYSILNPNLVKAANFGHNEKDVRLFYVLDNS